MPNDQLIMTHDIGTSGNKAMVVNKSGQIVASKSVPYDTFYLQHNGVEQNPLDWWKAVCDASNHLMKEANISPSQIACVSFSGQMMGAVPVDENGNPLHRALIWADMRANEIIDRILKKHSAYELYTLTGNRISASYSAAKIHWLKTYERNIYERTYKFLQAKDFLVAKLTGEYVTDYSDASGTNLLNIHTKEWSDELLTAFEIDDAKLPAIVPSTTVVGTVHEQAEKETGLLKGTPVVLGGADGACAALGAGVLEDGDIFNYIGSSSWIALASTKPIVDGKMRTFNFIHVDEQKYIPIGTMQTAGLSVEWMKNHLYKDMLQNDMDVYKAMNEDAAAAPIGANKLLFLPYLLGERSPWWNDKIRGGFIGLSMTHSRGDMIRSTLEGISFNLKVILETFNENGMSIKDMWIFGGGANSKIWCQMLANVYGVPIYVPKEVDETTSMGAALIGGVGIGLLDHLSEAKKWSQKQYTYKPSKKHMHEYRRLYEMFLQLHHAMEPLYNEWNNER